MTKLAKPSRAQVLFEEHYKFRAQYNGDEQPKKDAASAKRVATSLRNAVNEFGRLLDAMQAKTLGDAAGIIDALAKDLDAACKMARKCQADKTTEDQQRRREKADEVAARRWRGDDAAMMAEARELAAFVDQARVLDSDDWILTQHAGCDLVNYPDDIPPGRRLIDMLNDHKGSVEEVLSLRRRAAEYIAALESPQQRALRNYKGMWRVGLDDFEAWCAWRRGVMAAITPPAGAR